MADEDTISLENLKKYAELLTGELKANAESFISSLERQNVVMATSAEVSGALGKGVGEIGNALKQSAEFVGLFTRDLKSSFDLLSSSIGSATDGIDSFGVKTGFALGTALSIIPRTSEAFSDLGKAGNISGSQIHAGYSTISPLLEKMISGLDIGKKAVDFLSQGFENLTKSADIGTNLERNLIRLAARAGDLNQILTQQGRAYKDLQTESTSYASLTYEIAQATGASVAEVQKYAEGLSVIPGSLKRTALVMGDTRSTMSELEAVMKVASAFGMSNAESVDLMTFAYNNLNKTGSDAVSMIANIAATSQDTLLPLQLVSDYVQRTSESFKLLGDNSGSAMNIMKAFSPILKESGLGPTGIQEIIQSMTSGIERMDIAHKAFMSSASGGPGGLAGGFQMDYLLQQGKLDEVMNKTMEAMQRQFGSAPVTLEDVNNTPELAGELLKQVSFLKDVSGLAQNDQQAYRILEAMQKGAPQELAQIRETSQPNEVLERSLKLGQDIQERGNTELTKIYNRLGHMADLAAISNSALLRGAIGSEGFTDIPGFMKENSEKVSERGGVFGAERPVNFDRALDEQTDTVVEIKEGLKDVLMPLMENFGVDTSKMSEMFDNLMNKEPGQATESGDLLNKLLNMVGVTPEQDKLQNGLALPNVEGSGPLSITSGINEVIKDEKVMERAIRQDILPPFEGKLDINVQVTGLDQINASIDKKLEIDRRRRLQGALIGNDS